MNIKIIVASHKAYRLPEDPVYFPILGGADFNQPVEGFQPDNIGENISKKNKFYSELTTLFWAWKNLDYDYLGVSHYRRHFVSRKTKDKWSGLLTGSDCEKLFEKYDCIVPNKRKYYIETMYSHYVHAHGAKYLDAAIKVIEEKYPNYLPACTKVMNSTSAHMFNMFIMKRELVDSYCSFLFDVLETIELDLGNFHRIFGHVSELMLDVFLLTNNVNFVEVPVVFMENEKWAKKIWGFLMRKFKNKK